MQKGKGGIRVEKIKEGHRGEEDGGKARKRQANTNWQAGKQESKQMRQEKEKKNARLFTYFILSPYSVD